MQLPGNLYSQGVVATSFDTDISSEGQKAFHLQGITEIIAICWQYHSCLRLWIQVSQIKAWARIKRQSWKTEHTPGLKGYTHVQGHVHAQKIPEKEESPSHSSLVDFETLRKEEV